MNNPTPTEKPNIQSANPEPAPTSPVRCLIGAVISGGIAIALYSLTTAIAQNFAARPIHSDNQTVINITAAVRTLVVGMVALGTGIFGLVAVGLVALAIQISIQQITKRFAPPTDGQ